MKSSDPNTLKVALPAVAVGLMYGLLCRFVYGTDLLGKEVLDVMSATFICGVPISLGFLTMIVHREREGLGFWHYLTLPWMSGFLFLISTLILAWEGLICIFLWIPLVMCLSSLGGLLAMLALWAIKVRRNRMYCTSLVCALPFLLAPIENLKERASEIRSVRSQIVIHAPVDVVWKNIERVPAITEKEHRFSFVHLMGFPRPIEAKLIGEGIGAVRHATFEGDVLFLEHITEWQRNEKLSFTITANTENIPPDTFDEHVTIGGPYFDVLNGGYEIEILGENRILLHLSSQQRLSTNFNFYSHLWTEWLMKSIQDYILEIIKERCESN
jgi:hypothetical protein|tara:strand:+ start:281 stop:1264 length:984 start_codon:yes stop_codon:yes gene_type:complete